MGFWENHSGDPAHSSWSSPACSSENYSDKSWARHLDWFCWLLFYSFHIHFYPSSNHCLFISSYNNYLHWIDRKWRFISFWLVISCQRVLVFGPLYALGPLLPSVSAIQLIKVAITSDCSPTWTHSDFFFQFPGHSPQTTSFISSWIACHRQINRPLTSIHKPSASSRLFICPLLQYHQASIRETDKTPTRLETSILALF